MRPTAPGTARRNCVNPPAAGVSGAIIALAALLIGSGPVRATQDRKGSPQRPNVLLIITDQQRADALGYRQPGALRTPHLDALAAGGISFDRALTPTPICTPARTALVTSQYGHQTRTMSNGDTLQDEPVLFTRLRDRGYQVDYAGKWHLGESNKSKWVDRLQGDDRAEYSRWCLKQGIPDGWAFNDPAMRSHRRADVSIPRPAVNPIKPEQTNEAWIVDHALRMLDTRDRSRPYFLTVSLNGPHPPFKVPERYFSMYDASAIPQPPNFGPTPGEPAALSRSFYRTVFRDHGETWAAWRKSTAVYRGFVTMVDAQIGRVIKRFEDERLLDSTFVIMTTDHGEMMGQHGLWQKYHAYEEALRVPLIMRAPWLIGRGVRSDAAASLIDIAPTVFAALGVRAPSTLQGVDLSPSFSGAAPAGEPRLLFSEFHPKGDWHGVVDWRLVTDNRHKYVWNRGDIAELYDLGADPHELKNLARSSAHRAVAVQLQEQLHAWMRRTQDPLVSAFAEQRTDP